MKNLKKYRKIIFIVFFLVAFFTTICFIPIRASKLIPIIEEQITSELGVNAHLDKLVLRFGPNLKVKAPIVHVTYKNGEKFAQFNNVKFYIPWSSLFKNNFKVNSIKAKKISLRLNLDDENLDSLLKQFEKQNLSVLPYIYLDAYTITFKESKNSTNSYTLVGQSFDLKDRIGAKSIRVKAKGNLNINSDKFITYDFVLEPEKNIFELNNDIDIFDYLQQIKDLNFYSDIIADLKIYKNSDKITQASGFINVDNISILDKDKKDPKSFVYLTFWGDKASILSNIYTAVNKKVYIEGVVNNSKKPVVDIKVKTDEIAIKDLYKKIKLLTNFSQLKNITDIDGILYANFNLKGDLHKIKSNGFLNINNASIDAKGIRVNNINSEIDFSNNIINIKKAIGQVNQTPIILEGSIDKSVKLKLLMDKVELKYLLPEKYGVKNGLASLIADISGTLDNIIHKENLFIENLSVKNDKIDLSIDSLKFDTNKNNTAYIQNLVCNTLYTEEIKIPSLNLMVNSDDIKIPDTNIYMKNSKVTAKSEILNFSNPKMLNFVANFKGYVNSRDLKSFSKYSTRFPVYLTLNGNKSTQNIMYQMLCEKTDILDEPSVINLTAKLEKNGLKIEDLSLVGLSGQFSEDYKANIKGSKKLTITGLIENLRTPVLKNLRVFIPQQLNLKFNDTLAQIKGDLFINGDYKKPDIIGQLVLQNLYNELLNLSVTGCSFDFNKTQLVLNAPQVKLADISMGVNALVSTDISEYLNVKNLNIKSKYFSTDTILMYKDVPLIKSLPIKISDGTFYSERAFIDLYGSPLYLSALSANFELNDNILDVKKISAELFNGKLKGAIKYNLKNEIYDAEFMTRGVSAEPIFNVISLRKDDISGTMDFDAKLNGDLTSKQSLSGNLKFIINNGRMSTLGKLEHLLYAQNVIADNMLRTSFSVIAKALTLKDTGLFKYLRGDVDLQDGIADIRLLQSQGPLMSLFIKGKYNILNDNAKLTVLGRLSDEVISGMGAFGDFSFNKLLIMLTGEDNRNNIRPEDFDLIPQLPMKNTKEFRSIIDGKIDTASSVKAFNWISYSEKQFKIKEKPMTNEKVPEFIEALPY
ncbi:hypothetical protein IJ384_04965 [bacterium]|nr:hypothetical protein [bacterium]